MKMQWLVAWSVLAALGCGGDDDAPCVGGICVDSGRDASSADSGGDVGPDAQIDAAGFDADGRDAAGFDAAVRDVGADGCVEVWECSPWETRGGDAATRTCVDANGCGSTATRPTLNATLPDLDPEFYECEVEPILQRSCAQLACHGTETGRPLRLYARGRLRVMGETIAEHPEFPGFCPPRSSDGCIGSLDCNCANPAMLPVERRRSFDSARGFALEADGTPFADSSNSELVQQPALGGGFPHAGLHFWADDDPEPRRIIRWLDGERLGRRCNSGN